MVGWTYDGPYDKFEAQSEPGGFPIVNEKLKEDREFRISLPESYATNKMW